MKNNQLNNWIYSIKKRKKFDKLFLFQLFLE